MHKHTTKQEKQFNKQKLIDESWVQKKEKHQHAHVDETGRTVRRQSVRE